MRGVTEWGDKAYWIQIDPDDADILQVVSCPKNDFNVAYTVEATETGFTTIFDRTNEFFSNYELLGTVLRVANGVLIASAVMIYDRLPTLYGQNVQLVSFWNSGAGWSSAFFFYGLGNEPTPGAVEYWNNFSVLDIYYDPTALKYALITGWDFHYSGGWSYFTTAYNAFDFTNLTFYELSSTSESLYAGYYDIAADLWYCLWASGGTFHILSCSLSVGSGSFIDTGETLPFSVPTSYNIFNQLYWKDGKKYFCMDNTYFRWFDLATGEWQSKTVDSPTDINGSIWYLKENGSYSVWGVFWNDNLQKIAEGGSLEPLQIIELINAHVGYGSGVNHAWFSTGTAIYQLLPGTKKSLPNLYDYKTEVTGVVQWGTANTPSDSDWTDSGMSTFKVVDKFEGHRNPFHLIGTNKNIELSFTEQTTGELTIEFLINPQQIDEDIFIDVRDSSSSVLYIQFAADGNIDFVGATSDTDIKTYTTGWLHGKVVWTKNSTATLYINGFPISSITANNLNTDRIRILCQDTDTECYFDALGFSWDSYIAGSNLDGPEIVGDLSNIHIINEYLQAPTAKLTDYSTKNKWGYREFVIITEDDGIQVFEGYIDKPEYDGTSRIVTMFNPTLDDLSLPISKTYVDKTAQFIIKDLIDTYPSFMYYLTSSISTIPIATYSYEFNGTLGDAFQTIDEDSNYKYTIGVDGLFTWNIGTISANYDWKRANADILPGVVDWGTWDNHDLSDWTDSPNHDTFEVVHLSTNSKNVIHAIGDTGDILSYTPTTQTTGTIQLRIKMAQVDKQVNFRLVDSGANLICQVIFEADGNIDFEGTALDGDIQAYVANVWYNLKIDYLKNSDCTLTVDTTIVSTVTGGNYDVERLQFVANSADVEYWYDVIGLSQNGYVSGANTEQLTDTNTEQVDIIPETFQPSSIRVIGGDNGGARVNIVVKSPNDFGNESIQKYKPEINTDAGAESYGTNFLAANNVEQNTISCKVTGQQQMDYSGSILFRNGLPFDFTKAACYIMYVDYEMLAGKNDLTLYDALIYKQTKEEMDNGDITPRKNFQAVGSLASQTQTIEERVETNEGDISDNESRITDNESDISDNADEIDLKNTICALSTNASQSIPYNTWTKVTWNVEVLDPKGLHSQISNTNRITIAETGTYKIYVNIPFAGQAGTSGSGLFRVFYNGNTANLWGVGGKALNIGWWTELVCILNETITAGTFLEVEVWQNQSTAGSLNIDSQYGCFRVERMS